MDNNTSIKKKHKWYVILLSVIGIIFALSPGTLLGLGLAVASLIIARVTKSSEQLPLIAILVGGLATIVAFFFF